MTYFFALSSAVQLAGAYYAFNEGNPIGWLFIFGAVLCGGTAVLTYVDR